MSVLPDVANTCFIFPQHAAAILEDATLVLTAEALFTVALTSRLLPRTMPRPFAASPSASSHFVLFLLFAVVFLFLVFINSQQPAQTNELS